MQAAQALTSRAVVLLVQLLEPLFAAACLIGKCGHGHLERSCRFRRAQRRCIPPAQRRRSPTRMTGACPAGECHPELPVPPPIAALQLGDQRTQPLQTARKGSVLEKKGTVLGQENLPFLADLLLQRVVEGGGEVGVLVPVGDHDAAAGGRQRLEDVRAGDLGH